MRKLAVCGCIVIAFMLADEPAQSTWDGVYTDDQAKRGESGYRDNCASCHGATLAGGESAPPLTGGDFLANWNGLTVGDLYERIRTTMPIDKPGKLSRQTNADILAFIFAANKFPAGQTELSTKTEFLKQIRIDATKPEHKEVRP